MKKIFVVAAMVILNTTCRAQSDTRPWMALESRIGLAMGLGKVVYLDQNSSPLIYKAKPKNVRIFYTLESNDLLFSIDLDVKMGGTSPKYHHGRTAFFHEYDYKGKDEVKKFPVGSSFLGGRISLGVFYKIASTQESTFKVAAGVRISNEMFYPQGWTSSGIFNALSLAPEGWAQHRINDYHSFTAKVRLPILTRLTRTPYDNTVSAPNESLVGGFFRNSKWVGAAKYLAPSLGIDYNYQIDQRWGTGLTYDLSWYNIPTPQRMKAISQSLLANFHHQF